MQATFLKSISALYASDVERRLKTCLRCGCEYSDITQRSVGKCCSSTCSSALMAAKRHANGTYVRTEEQNRKTAESCKRTYAEHGVSPETRAKLRVANLAARAAGKFDHVNGENHWTKRPEAKAQLSVINKGRVFSTVARQHMSIGARKRIRTKRETHYTSAHGGYRSDIGIYVRSGWEANFARILMHLGKRWSYEPRSFVLTDTMSYTPDFYVEDDNTYYELKGRMNERSIEQLHLMQSLYSDVTVVLIDGTAYDALRTAYKNIVQWEGK